MLSIVIPAFNEEELLGAPLAAASAATCALPDDVEVIVADDASTDGTAAVARAHGARVVSVAHRQIAATRNAGARAARGDLLVFLDADTLVGEAVVHAAVAALRDGAVGGGCGVRFDGRLPLHGRALQTVVVPLYRACGLASGCFLFCTRDSFDRVGGFDEKLYGAEELAMSRALHRLGRFVVLREHVVTSGRKLRAYSAREIFGLLGRLTLRMPRSVQTREGLDAWYGTRRHDPG
jgi:glycosyltransferase involved in cell wall biosynthesis